MGGRGLGGRAGDTEVGGGYGGGRGIRRWAGDTEVGGGYGGGREIRRWAVEIRRWAGAIVGAGGASLYWMGARKRLNAVGCGAGRILSRSAVAQSVERSAVNRLVVGSNPTRGANSLKVRDSSARFGECGGSMEELVRRVPACVAEVAGAIPARFVHGVELAEMAGAIPARSVHGVGPPRSGECGGRGRGDSGSFCARSWSAAFRRVWRKGPGRFRLVLCMELVRRVPASVAEVAGAIPARFVHGVGPPRSGECGGSSGGRSWSAAFRRVWRKRPGRFHSSWPTR